MTDTTNSYKLVEFRDYNGINLEKFMIELNDQMHANIFPTNFEKALEHYNNCIKTPINKHASRNAKKIKNVPSCPWFDHEYVQLRRKRRKAERLFKKNKLSEHKTLYAKLKRQCLRP